jgi:hypothetical protein
MKYEDIIVGARVMVLWAYTPYIRNKGLSGRVGFVVRKTPHYVVVVIDGHDYMLRPGEIIDTTSRALTYNVA